MVMNPELLGIIFVGCILFFMAAGVWFSVRGAAAESRAEFAQQSERMTLMEERIARIEGALFFGPSAVQSLPQSKEPRSPSSSDVTKGW